VAPGARSVRSTRRQAWSRRPSTGSRSLTGQAGCDDIEGRQGRVSRLLVEYGQVVLDRRGPNESTITDRLATCQ